MNKSVCLILAAIALFAMALATPFVWAATVDDPITNPDAVPHHIDRSAMALQLQGWTRDKKYPVFPVTVMNGTNGVYYTTNEHAKNYAAFDFSQLRCEIGDAPIEVLKDPKYQCADGVCFPKATGGIIGTDPRVKAKKGKC